MKSHDIHTHTTYSDGFLSPEDLIEEAIARNLEILGICDHGFSRKLMDTYQITSCLEKYLKHLKELQNTLDGLELKIGIEIDVSRIYGTEPSKLPFKILNQFDYILFEYVDTEKEYWGEVGIRDISEIIEIRKELVVPVGLAHNDIQQNYHGNESEISKTLAQHDIFVEIQYLGEFDLGGGENAMSIIIPSVGIRF